MAFQCAPTGAGLGLDVVMRAACGCGIHGARMTQHAGYTSYLELPPATRGAWACPFYDLIAMDKRAFLNGNGEEKPLGAQRVWDSAVSRQSAQAGAQELVTELCGRHLQVSQLRRAR